MFFGDGQCIARFVILYLCRDFGGCVAMKLNTSFTLSRFPTMESKLQGWLEGILNQQPLWPAFTGPVCVNGTMAAWPWLHEGDQPNDLTGPGSDDLSCWNKEPKRSVANRTRSYMALLILRDSHLHRTQKCHSWLTHRQVKPLWRDQMGYHSAYNTHTHHCLEPFGWKQGA